MKKALFIFICFVFSNNLIGQERLISSPKLSPFQKTEIKIGIVDVELEYSRPSMRGRTIFGGLVPYGKIWRTGANKNTKIVFKDKVRIGNTDLDAGTYTIFTKPNEDKWEVYFHTLLDEYGSPDTLDEKNIVAQITVPVTKLNRNIETLSIDFENLTSSSAILAISWERIFIPIKIEIPTGELMEKRLAANTKTLASNYSMAAWNYFKIEKENEKALNAINQAIALTEGEKTFEEWLVDIDLEDWSLPWKYQIKSEMHAALGDKKAAIEAAEKSLKIAETLTVKTSYTKTNKANIQKWKD